MDINYLSDDDEKEIIKKNNKYDNDYLPPNDYDEEEELDEEELEYLKQQHIIIMNAAQNKSIFDTNFFSYEEKERLKEKDVIKNIKNEKDKYMTIKDFNKLIDKKNKENEPKKFISKRSLEKKKISESENINKIIEYKRTFNPRLPPYFEINKRYNKF